MKKSICVFAMLVMFGALCAGCNDQGKTPPESTKQSQESEDNNWKPEMAAPPGTVDEHAGHDHGPGGHVYGPAASQPAPVDEHAGHDHGPGGHVYGPAASQPAPVDEHAGHDHGPGGHVYGPAASQPAPVDEHAGHDHGPGGHDHD